MVWFVVVSFSKTQTIWLFTWLHVWDLMPLYSDGICFVPHHFNSDYVQYIDFKFDIYYNYSVYKLFDFALAIN